MMKPRDDHTDMDGETDTDTAPQGGVPDGVDVPEPAAPEDLAPDTEAPAGVAAGVPMEPAPEAIKRLEEELVGLRDQYARLAAEFDNYRKRVARETQVLAERSQASLTIKVLDVLDDLDRILDGVDDGTTAPTLREALVMVDRKLRKELEAAGLERIDPTGMRFDPSLHEAVATTPATVPEQDDHVSATFQAGYLFKGNLIRPARVQVFTNQGQG